MNGFKTQQKRWTKGSIQTCLKILPRVWEASVPLHVKLEAPPTSPPTWATCCS